jgi:hypothetical protein
MYKTKSGLEVHILHQCSSQMRQLIGYIVLTDFTEVPAIWNPRGECFSRILGTTTKFDEFDLVMPLED